jgi:hypothetical protein
MRYLLLMAVVLVSLCVNMPSFPFLSVPTTNSAGTEFSNGEVSLNVNVLPSEISGGGDVTAIFQLVSKAGYDLENVKFEIYDPCVFSGETQKDTFCPTCKKGELKSNRTYSWSWDLKSDVITLSRDCNLKFNLVYDGKASTYQDIAVLTKAEYNTRLLQGTLGSIPISSSCSSSPLVIALTSTEGQPLLDGSSYDMQIDYSYTGSGFISVPTVTIAVPGNLKVIRCTDYTGTGTLTLSPRVLKFINKKAYASICTFTASASKPIDIQSLTIDASYTYTIDGSIPVTVRGTSPSQPTATSGK